MLQLTTFGCLVARLFHCFYVSLTWLLDHGLHNLIKPFNRCLSVFTVFTYFTTETFYCLSVLMSCVETSSSDCACRYTLTLMNEIIQKQPSEMKDSFNHVPSIHEVDEEESDEERTCDDEQKTPKDMEQAMDAIKDTADEDSIYSNDSFCSDESCNESEETNVTSRSLNESYASPKVSNLKENHEETKSEHGAAENGKTINEIINSARCKSSISNDNTAAGVKQARRRRNMSFTDEEMRKIEWENQLLLRKIMAQQKPKEKILRENVPLPRISSSAINRKKLQKKIENENMFLLQRIQQTKSRVMNNTSKPGCRQTIL